MLRKINITRYVTPLREGGSLPAIVEGDDLGTYVLKFRGAGQGKKALVAEVIAGELARKLRLPVPELVLANLDPVLARGEPDPEIQDLIRASEGSNLAMDYLPGSLGFDPLASPMNPELASRILWFDALVTNVDRTPHNTNLLLWHGKVWLIDHGASLYFHHAWKGWESKTKLPFAAARDHVLLPLATEIKEADEQMAAKLSEETLREVLGLAPDEWLEGESGFEDASEVREAYFQYLSKRLEGPRKWVHALEEAHEQAL
ncbi:MAG: HipA family kinase [Rubrobacteraceae bacterium]